MRQLVLAIAALLLVGCADPPEGIFSVDETTLPWAVPDTVRTYVTGDVVGEQVLWGEPDAQQKSWLKQHAYVRDRVELNPEATDRFQKRTEDIPSMEKTVMGEAYYIQD